MIRTLINLQNAVVIQSAQIAQAMGFPVGAVVRKELQHLGLLHPDGRLPKADGQPQFPEVGRKGRHSAPGGGGILPVCQAEYCPAQACKALRRWRI